jgi:hypothetical protein
MSVTVDSYRQEPRYIEDITGTKDDVEAYTQEFKKRWEGYQPTVHWTRNLSNGQVMRRLSRYENSD